MFRRWVGGPGSLLNKHRMLKPERFHSAKSLLSTGVFRDPDAYVSPYDISKPLEYLVIHNRSKHARNFAIRKFRDVWPDIKLIQVVEQGSDAVPGSDHEIHLKDSKSWASFEEFKTKLDALAMREPLLRFSLQQNKVGFYSVWSTQAESAPWARQVIKGGLVWCGASPDKMEGLDKTEYKKLAHSLNLSTAPFFEVAKPEGIEDKELALDAMAQSLIEHYMNSPKLVDKAVFIKHNEGGGGRGSKKVAVVNIENVRHALRAVINDTGGNLNGVYVELALDLKDCMLLQMEIECDGKSMSPGCRLVWFNRENQKVLEIGFSDSAVLELIPQSVYDQCRAASQAVFEASGYDNRGTNEILLVKDKASHWQIYLLELNKRIQVENKAKSELVVDHMGRTRNVPAEQVMRALGYPAPKASDFSDRGIPIVAHVRLLSSEITATGSKYHDGVVIDGAIYPQGSDVLIARGPVHLNADPQVGYVLLNARNWIDMCDKLLRFSREFQFYGPNTERATYFDFLRKLASNPEFREGKLGCNNTFNVLSDPPVEKGRSQKIYDTLVTHGYRPNEGVENQPYPTTDQINKYKKAMQTLEHETIPETPFSRYLKHHDYEQFIREKKDQLARHGGGSVTVIRDRQQSQVDQESALIQRPSAKAAQVFFARSGMGVGYETGGAQYQAGLMRQFDWFDVLLDGCLLNMESHSLTRSHWLNGLTIKSEAEIAFVLAVIGKLVLEHYGLSSDRQSFIPWMPNNFHAGNHPVQDVTTRLMLKANLAVIPNFAWDHRYTENQFRGWVKRQIDLFEQEGKPLHQIRIKNPGQSRFWNEQVIVRHVQVIRAMFAEHHLPEPIIHIHNHEFNGAAAMIAHAALLACQKMGYDFLIVDSVPPSASLSHSSNLVIADALQMTPEEKENLHAYNRVMKPVLDLTNRFNNSNLAVTDPFSSMAGGTQSSDLAGAREMGIPEHRIAPAIELARRVIGLGTPVTPFSEWLKQIGFAIEKNDAISNKTEEGVIAYIEAGGKLQIATSILEGLQAWETLLKKPEIVKQLLINHGFAPEAEPRKHSTEKTLDVASMKTDLQAKFPNLRISDREVATVVGFDKIGWSFLATMNRRDKTSTPRNMTPMMESPEFVYSKHKREGDRFRLFGQEVTLGHTSAGKVEFHYQGHTIRTEGINPDQRTSAATKVVRLVKDKELECGASTPGKLTIKVKPGDVLKKGQIVGFIECMKMEHPVQAPEDGLVVDWVRPENENEGKVAENEVIATWRKAPSPVMQM